MPHLERASNASCASNASNASFGASFQFHDVGSSSETGNRYGTLNQVGPAWHGHALALAACMHAGARHLMHACMTQDYVAVQEVYTPEEVPDSGKQVYIQAICDGEAPCGHCKPSITGMGGMCSRAMWLSQLPY